MVYKGREKLEQVYGQKYVKIDDDESVRCFYCGAYGGCEDHVPPMSRAEVYSQQGWRYFFTVRSCNECNATLSNVDIPVIDGRILFLIEKYKNKYSKILSQPEWDYAEKKVLGKNMKKYVERCEKAKDSIVERLYYLKSAVKRAKYLY